MEKTNQKTLEELRHVKEQLQEQNRKIIDIITYGNIDYTNDFVDNPEKIYIVKEEIKGQLKTSFYAGKEKMGEVNEDGVLVLEGTYQKKLDDAKFLEELNSSNTYSLNTLEEMLEKQGIKIGQKKARIVEFGEEKRKNLMEKYDIEIDLNKKITSTESLKDFMPEISKKGYQRVVAREESNKRYQFYGITKEGKQEPITLEMTEGTNPNQDMISTDSRGNGDRRVEKEQAYSMFKLPGRPNEGISIRKGEMGIEEVDYWRRTPQDEYENIPINLKSTNQKNTDTRVQRHLDKTKTNKEHIQTDIENADELIAPKEEIEFEALHPETNPKIQSFETLDEKIKQAAKEMHVSVKKFLVLYNTIQGDTYREKIENTKKELQKEKENSIDRAR